MIKSIFQKYGSVFLGFCSGILNGLFGSGGGIAVVPMLEKLKVIPQKAHATSVAIILPLSIASIIFYRVQNIPVHSKELSWMIPFGLFGSIIGTQLLKKIPNNLLRRIFGIIMIYSGIRLLLS